MALLVAVDPGKHTGGLALFRDFSLIEATVVDVRSTTSAEGGGEQRFAVTFATAVRRRVDAARKVGEFVELIQEDQEVYEQRGLTGKRLFAVANDLLWLSKTMGAVEYALREFALHRVKPKHWKGQVDADALLERIARRKLHANEIPVWQSLKDRFGDAWHHGGDAVGLGLWKLGRL